MSCLYCAGCGQTLEMSDIEEEGSGDEMYIVPRNDGTGEEDVYCEDCHVTRLSTGDEKGH